MSRLKKLVEMDHEVGKSNSPPKMTAIEHYYWWNDRFEEWMRFNNLGTWLCIENGYVAPTREVDGVRRVPLFEKMEEEGKLMYEAENKARAAITMSLPQDILHTFKRYRTSKELWEALERRFEGNEDVKKNKVLKKQFAVFRHFKDETLEEIITRFYHLMTELGNQV